MNFLSVFFLFALAVVLAIVDLRQRALPLVACSLSLKELIDRALVAVKSLDSEMDNLRESFRPSAYVGVGGPIAWTAQVRERLLERLEHVKLCLSRMNSNVRTFEELGSLASTFTLGQDNLAQEIITKAAGCKVELKHLERRIKIYDLVPIVLWPMLGRKMANSCLNVGNDLIQQYEQLAERVLVFARARGDRYQYECLLSAL